MMTELFSIDGSQAANPSRKAALVLHALSEEDRDWMFTQLSDAQQEQLRPMLEELQALGVPRNLDLIRDLLHADSDAASLKVPLLHETTSTFSFDEHTDQVSENDVFIAKVNQLSLSECVELLAHETVFLTAHLLHMYEWLWKYEFLNQLPRAKRQQIELLLSQIRVASIVPTALHTAMRRLILSRLPDVEEIRTAPSAPFLPDKVEHKKPMHQRFLALFRSENHSGRSRS